MEDVPLTEIPLPDTRIKILDGYMDLSLGFYKSESSKEVSLMAEGNIDKGKIYLSEWDEQITQIKGNFIIEDKELRIDSLHGQFKDFPLSSQAHVDLNAPYPFDVDVKANGMSLEAISSFFPFLKDYTMIKTPAEVEFSIHGVLPDGPIEWLITLQEAFVYSVLMSDVELSFFWDGNKVIVRNFSANLDEGKISGEGELHLKQK